MVERHIEDSFDDLVGQSNEVIKDRMLKVCSNRFRDLAGMFEKMGPDFGGISLSLTEFAESIDAFFDSDDPRSNGWVGDDGLP